MNETEVNCTKKVVLTPEIVANSEKVEIDLEEECCRICRFMLWTSRIAGECHRRPPKQKKPDVGSYWPGVDPSEWCGEFEKEVL